MDTKCELVISAIRGQLDDTNRTVDIDSRIDELGLDSLKYMMLIIELESNHEQVSVDVKNIGSAATVGDLINLVSYG